MVRTAAAGGGMAEAEGLQDGGEVEGDGLRQEAAAAASGVVAGVPGVDAVGGRAVRRAGAAIVHGDIGGEHGGKRVRVGLPSPRPWHRWKHRHHRPCRTPRSRGSSPPCSFVWVL
jgi:hypothetical protein